MPATLGVLPSVLPSYREAFPLVDLSVATVGLDEQIRALLERRIDVGVLRGPVTDERIHAARMAREYFCVSVPREHRLASRARVSPRDLNGETLLALTAERGGSFNEDAIAMLRRARVRPAATIDVADVAAVFALVASGAGIAVSSTVWTNVVFSHVVHRPLVPRTPIETMMLAWRADRRAVPVVRSFIEHLAAMNLTFDPPE
jgi:DNA-binding transcriptional LysR family regulator